MESLARIVEVVRVKGGCGSVKVQYSDGNYEHLDVVAGGWGDRFDSAPSWPPQVGDRVSVRRQTVVVVKSRKSKA